MINKLLSEFDRRTGATVWAVEFTDSRGRLLLTSWTTYRAEAAAWHRNIQLTGWTTEGRPGSALDVYGEALNA